jgi:hypothetical protein
MTQTNSVDRVLVAMEREFMRPSFTRMLDWFEIDGTCGITALALEDAPKAAVDAMHDTSLDDQPLFDALKSALEDYYEGDIQEISTTKGFGARLSAPGYMEATDWCVFPTLAEAKEYLVDMYGDSVELDDDAETETE